MVKQKPHQQLEEELVELLAPVHKLILHNDDFHSFDFVIDALIEVCNHSPEQAEQCAHIVHYKGLCDVKRGTKKAIEKPYRFLAEKGLLVSIE